MPDLPSRIAVDVRDVRKVFGTSAAPVVALADVSVAIGENEFFTLLGPSGCGKTTLLRLIAGFDYPTSGQILLHGEDIALLPPFKRPVNTVFQSYALFPHMTVAENIGFGLEMLGRRRAEVSDRVSAMLKLVRMEELASRSTSQISGGQQQRVALARALAPQPKVLLLDEPLSALDYKLRKEMQIELKRLQHETGITFIFVTHDQEEALAMSDRIAVMSNGKILQIGTPRDIYDRPSERFVADFIGETNFLSAEILARSGATATVRLFSGAEICAALPERFSRDGRVTIVVRPEHAQLIDPGAQGTLKGEVENIVYLGTDTHFHLRLEDGNHFIIRRQNSRGMPLGIASGSPVGILIDDNAAQVLRD
ncbi:spermidine/putrescine transport system ATP-binding protein [Rhodoligotrophos appendicifer]|uniref:ABC transporter ATP-binding protein n=1 Tax=Rhodoligotrophos appendicifer TaxID=987056 RepID=UPI001184A8D8|nr:ABC transporter ATP-binding protein [Rhodoligotrophos appendicifer]